MPYDSETKMTGPYFEARYSDGRTAAARDIRVALSKHGLLLRQDYPAGDEVWPYTSLTTAEPLSSHAIDALISNAAQPGASLFVPNGSFARQLAQLAPHLTTRAARRRAAVPWLITAAVIVAIAAAISAAQFSPARAIASMMPDKVRKALGNQAVRSLTKSKPSCMQAEGLAAVSAMTRRLSSGLDGGRTFNVTVVDLGLVNAFATPGNRIVLTRGLIEKAGSADEVAGVLAHEIGHAVALDPETGIVRAIGMSAAVELMFGGSGTVSNIGVLLAQLSYTRQAEAQADETALRLLEKAGISAKGFGQFFRRVNKEGDAGSDSAGGIAGMLRTHPPTAERIRRVDAANTYRATPALSPEQWQAMKAMCPKAAKEDG